MEQIYLFIYEHLQNEGVFHLPSMFHERKSQLSFDSYVKCHSVSEKAVQWYESCL
jgi:hypothetical protein